jgi:hypothetical protein
LIGLSPRVFPDAVAGAEYFSSKYRQNSSVELCDMGGHVTRFLHTT